MLSNSSSKATLIESTRLPSLWFLSVSPRLNHHIGFFVFCLSFIFNYLDRFISELIAICLYLLWALSYLTLRLLFMFLGTTDSDSSGTIIYKKSRRPNLANKKKTANTAAALSPTAQMLSQNLSTGEWLVKCHWLWVWRHWVYDWIFFSTDCLIGSL